MTIDPDVSANETGSLYLSNDAGAWTPTSITVTPSSTGGGLISSVSVSPVEYWYSIPAVYLSGYGGYGYTANYTWAALTVTAASGTTWVPGSGSASGTTQNFGSTTSFAGESADQTYTFTIADAGIDALLRWNWYTTITYSVPQNDPPVAEFSASNTTPYFNELVTLSDLSTNAPSGWQMDI